MNNKVIDNNNNQVNNHNAFETQKTYINKHYFFGKTNIYIQSTTEWIIMGEFEKLYEGLNSLMNILFVIKNKKFNEM